MATIVLTERQKNLALHLLDHSDFLTAYALSTHFNVSEKSIRNDLAVVAAFLSENGVGIRKEPSKGTMITATEAERRAVTASLSQMASASLSSRQRLQIAALVLLCRERCTYQEIADLCLVSKLTIVRDARLLGEQLAEAGLFLQAKAGQGLSVAGEERRRRQYFIKLLKESRFQGEAFLDLLESLGLQPFFETASRFLQDLEGELRVTYLERPLLAAAIAHCMARRALGALPETQRGEGPEGDEYMEYSVVRNTLLPYGVTEPEEGRFIAGLVLEAKVAAADQGEVISPQDPSAAAIANSILEEIRTIFHLPDQTRDYASLFNALYLHLKVALFRIRKNLPVKNDLLEQVRITIPLVYELTKQILVKCERRYQLYFAEDETAFIAMHIAAICEAGIGLRNDMEILILCNFGLATSNVLRTRLLQMLPTCAILGPLSTEEGIRYMKDHQPDLVISTSKLPDGRPSIVVNPLLLDEDTERIHVAVAKKYYEKQCSFFIRAYAGAVKSGETIFLKNIVPLEDIHIIDHCPSWERAVYLTAESLLRRGDLESRYVEAILRSVNQLGNYMILLPEIAFVHAGTNDGINRRCASVLVLREPVLFGSKKQQDVRCIVLLGINDKTDGSLLNLIHVFENHINRIALQSKELTVNMIYQMHS